MKDSKSRAISIRELRARFAGAGEGQLKELILAYGQDGRAGVRREIGKAQGRLAALEREKERTAALWEYENRYQEYAHICGIDEAGRGPLAGPVVAAAVILPKGCGLLYINDSKKLSEKKREGLAGKILEEAISVGVGMASPQRIDEINILQATYEAMREAIGRLTVLPDLLLNDAVVIPEISCRQIAIVRGDAKSISIAAASIVAKVARDRLMMDYDRLYPEYGFASHKGYGAASHIDALKRHGPTPIHRQTFIGHFV